MPEPRLPLLFGRCRCDQHYPSRQTIILPVTNSKLDYTIYREGLGPEGHGNEAVSEEEPKPRQRLTPRECEILMATAEGLTSKKIAERLGLAESTVKDALARMMRRYQCANRMQLLSHVVNQLSDVDETSG